MSAAEETENHWPGYVDALTTMVMILIFVMMVLSVAFFSASSNTSRRLIDSLAEALGTNISGVGNSNDEAARALVNKIEAERERNAMEAARLAELARQAEMTRQADLARSLLITAPVEQREGANLAIESASAPPSPSPEQPVRADRGEAVLTLVFRPRATGIDAEAQKDLGRFAEEARARAPAATFRLVSYANSGAGALSDSRRVAYYRAMSARGQLIARGVPASQIILRI